MIRNFSLICLYAYMNETRREKNIEKKKKYFVYLKERGIYLRRFEERYDRSLE